MHKRELVTAGPSVTEAENVLIMLHGRGSNAQNILRVADLLPVDDFALLAPQATNNTWYPYSFMVPTGQNEPWLTSALEWLESLTDELLGQGLGPENMYFLGFSQGACLTLEFVARHARKYGGVVALTGGLIGDQIDRSRYSGDFENARIFISSGDPDPHIPVSRIGESVEVLADMNADVQSKIYANRPHTITREEVQIANAWIFDTDQ